MVAEERRLRRWFQLRLRSLLIIFALLCIGLAWIASERRHSARQLEVVEQLRPFDFDIQLGGKYDSLDRFYNKEPQGRWRRMARSLLGEHVIVANCYEYSFTDASILSELTDLKELSLVGTGVSDIRPLSGLCKLTALDLGDTDVVDVSPLATLTRIEVLSVTRTQVSDVSPLAKRMPRDGLFAAVRSQESHTT